MRVKATIVITFVLVLVTIMTPPNIPLASTNLIHQELHIPVEELPVQEGVAQKTLRGRWKRRLHPPEILSHQTLRLIDEQQRVLAEGLNITTFVVFHKELYDAMYIGLRHNTQRHLFFVAANPTIPKSFNHSNPLFRGQVVFEWEMSGYDKRVHTSFNEFGVMHTIFHSSHSERELLDTAWTGFFQYDMRIDTSLFALIAHRAARANQSSSAAAAAGAPRCCIFYAVTYPSAFLFTNALGVQLFREFNAFHHTKRHISDLPEQCIIDAYVVPTTVWTTMVMPWMDHVITAVARGSHRFPSPALPVTYLSDGQSVPARDAAGVNDILERALALAFAFVANYQLVQVPLRHERIE